MHLTKGNAMTSRLTRHLVLVAAVAVSSFAHAQSPCASPGANILAWWDGTAGAGNLTTDVIGSTDAVLQNGASIGPMGAFASAAYVFDGVDDVIDSAAEIEGLDGNNWTFEAWVRPTRLGVFQNIVCKLDPVGEQAGDFQLSLKSDGRLQMRYLTRASGGTTDLAFDTQAPVFSVGIPTHIAVSIVNGNGFRIFANGTQLPLVRRSVFAPLPTGPIDRRTTLGGRFDGSHAFEGEMTEVTFYDRLVPSAELTRIAQAGNAFKCKQAAPLPAGVATWYDGEFCRNHALDLIGLESAPLRPRTGSDVTIIGGIVGDGFDTNSGGGLNTERPLLRTTGPFTIEMWVIRRRNQQSEVLYSELNSAGLIAGEHILRFVDNGRIRLVRATGVNNQAEGATSIGRVPLDTWTHVAAVFAGPNDLRMFVNGQRGETNIGLTTTSNFPVPDGGFGVGNGGFPFLRGAMDECTLYRTAVSDADIEAIYRAGRFGKEPQATPGLSCRSGSGEDLTLDVTLSQGQVLASPSLQLSGNDSFLLSMKSPAGTFAFSPYGILIQGYDAATPPFGLPGSPEFAVDFGSSFFLAGGLTPTPFGLPLFNPNGAQVALIVPASLAGTRIRMQGFSINSAAANGTFAATDPIDLQVRSAVAGPGL